MNKNLVELDKLFKSNKFEVILISKENIDYGSRNTSNL